MAGNSKNALTPFHVINAQSMGASITGSPTNIQYLDNCSIQLNFTGTPTGSFSIQGSLDHAANALTGVEQTAGNWIEFTGASATGAANNILIDLNQLSFPWIRIVYTRVSGTGTLDAYISAKAV